MTTSDQTISVVIPTYNRDFCISRAIDSVLQQSHAAHEVIVVDDGSSDDTRKTVLQYGNKVRYIFQLNSGVSAARNTGVRAARGNWIAFLDSDDEWLRDKLFLQHTDLRKSPQAIAHMIDCSLGENHGRLQSVFGIRGLLRDFGKCPIRARPLCDVLQSAFFPSSWLIRRKAIESAGYFDSTMRICEDTDLLSRIALQGSFVVNCSIGTKLQRHGNSGALSDLYRLSRLEYFQNILRTYENLSISPQLTCSESAYVRTEYSAAWMEIAVLHRINGNSRGFWRALKSSLVVNTTFFSLLKAGILLGLGARAYDAMRRLKDSGRKSHQRRSATG